MAGAATTSPHRAALEALGLVGPAVSGLAAYLDILAAWSPRVNLTGARTPAARVRVLVEQVLPALGLVMPGRLLDIGSGNGSPGLVFALLRDDLQVTLLEPRARRWAFLREAVRAAGVRNVSVVRARHDEYRGTPATTLTVRGLALPLARLAPLVEPSGRLIVFGGRPTAEPPFEPAGGAPAGIHSFRRPPTVPRET